VPLCGKSLDMLWLEQQGLQVTGIEFAEQAVLEFCRENELGYTISEDSGMQVFQIKNKNIHLYVGDFFDFAKNYRGDLFAAIYDRAALVALPENRRKPYVDACQDLLQDEARGLLVTLRYPQELMPGPPFSVANIEVQQLWSGQAELLKCYEAIETLPKAKQAGITSLPESIWALQATNAG